MSNGYYLQTAIGLIAGLIMCTAWWYAAIKFPRVWIFSGLAIVATISILLHAGVLLLVASSQSGLVGQLSSIQVILYLVEAVLFILLVRWLVKCLKDQGKP
jgi:hypothetical protein